MQIVIDIPDDVYAEACVEAKREIHPHQDYRWIRILRSICEGTPLPNGHGRLIDANKLIKDNGLDKATKYGNKTKEQLQFSYDTMMMYEIFDLIDDVEVVVEADEKGADNGTD